MPPRKVLKPDFIIVAAGDIASEDIESIRKRDSFVCAADAGFIALNKAGIKPDLLIGDFDSFPGPDAVSVEKIRLPIEKDDTDTVFCVKEGLRRGYDSFVIYGGLGGGRVSHSIANIQLLSMIHDNNAAGRIIRGNTVIRLLSWGETARIDGKTGDNVSVFALSDKATVSAENLYYPMKELALTRRFPLGVSNHTTADTASVTVTDGEVLLVVENK